MRAAVVAAFGQWPADDIKAEIARAASAGELQVIVKGGVRVGLVSALPSETCWEIVQLFVEPAHQRGGVGRATVNGIVRQAARERKPVIARVLVTNPALAFWQRMGFTVVDSTDEHHLLERR
jgi:GNAT superfamily N-acetyltransferase